MFNLLKFIVVRFSFIVAFGSQVLAVSSDSSVEVLKLQVETGSLQACTEGLKINLSAMVTVEERQLIERFCILAVKKTHIAKLQSAVNVKKASNLEQLKSPKVEQLKSQKEQKELWSISVSLDGRFASGNEDTKQVGVKLSADKKFLKHKVRLNSEYFTKDTEKGSNSKASVAVTDDYLLNKKTVTFLVLSAARNEFKKEKIKLIGLVGVGRSLFGTEYYGDDSIKVSVGLGAEQKTLFSGAKTTDSILSWKLKTNKELRPNLELNTVTQLEHEIANLDGRTLDLGSELIFKNILSKEWDGFVGYEYKHDKKPASGVSGKDTSLSFGIKAKF